jgi:D-lactate dehydrogenase (cytochrome)
MREKEGEVWTTDGITTLTWLTVVAVPISKLPDLIEKSKNAFEKSGLHTTIVSHALDGNFRNISYQPNSRWNHVPQVIKLMARLYDKSTPGERRKAEQLVHEMVENAIDMEGTCTGGTSQVKLIRTRCRHGEKGISRRGTWSRNRRTHATNQGTPTITRLTQLALDPLEILNPGTSYMRLIVEKVVPVLHYPSPVPATMKRGGMTSAHV